MAAFDRNPFVRQLTEACPAILAGRFCAIDAKAACDAKTDRRIFCDSLLFRLSVFCLSNRSKILCLYVSFDGRTIHRVADL